MNKQKQLPYLSNIMSRDIKPANWSNPRGKPQTQPVKKVRSAFKKDIFSVLDVVVVVAVILIIKFLINHVSVDFH